MIDRHPSTTEDGLSRDTVFRLLSHTYRRALLESLDRHGPLTLTSASEEVALRNDTRPIEEIPSEVVERVRLSLYHSHVPKLIDEDVVTHDEDRDVVALTDRGERLVTVQSRISSVGES